MAKNLQREVSEVIYLGFKLLLLLEEIVIIGLENIVARFQCLVVLVELLGLPPGSSVLKPDGNLPWPQAEVPGQLNFPLWLELVLDFKALLQELDLVGREPPLLLWLVEAPVQLVVRSLLDFSWPVEGLVDCAPTDIFKVQHRSRT